MFKSIDHVYDYAINYLGATKEEVSFITDGCELQIIISRESVLVIFYCEIAALDELRHLMMPSEFEELGNSEISDKIGEYKDEIFARNINHFKIFIP